MIRYRIEVTVSAERVAEVLGAALQDAEFDPDLKINVVAEVLSALPARQPQNIQKARSATLVSREEVLERTLTTGPKRWSELRIALSHAGFPEWTINSLITIWQKTGRIRRNEDGLWSLAE